MDNKTALENLGIDLKRIRTSGKTLCPKCSHLRKKRNEPCLSVNIDEGVYKCHNPECSWSGAVNVKKKEKEKEYVRPSWMNNTTLSEPMVKWFESRGIRQGTLIEAKVTETRTYMPQVQKEVTTINFNYFRDSELINVKYRDGAKNFKLFKDAELIFYNLDAIKDLDEAIIVEGEMDCLSLIEAGIKNVVSVPNGASKGKSPDLKYLENCWEYFENKKKVYLAVDNDEAGMMLREELARRIGVDKCYKIDFGDCKDANEVLQKKGKLELEEILKAGKEFPISGIVHLSNDEFWDLYDNGLTCGATVGVHEIDNLITFEKGQMTTITGIPNQGKSEFMDFILEMLSINHGWKYGIFSPENFPLKLHASKLCEKIVGKPFSGKDKMSRMEAEAAKNYIDNHFYFIRPEDENFSLENILNLSRILVLKHGINGLVIDPWNRLEHQIPAGISETHYISQQLDKLTTFKQKYNLHIFLVAHPTKIKKDKSGAYEIPNLYDIAGSANFFNKTDNGIAIYRNFETGYTEMYVQKIKFKHLGKIGNAQFKWNFKNGRYTPVTKEEDNTNHLNKQEKTIDMFQDQPEIDIFGGDETAPF